MKIKSLSLWLSCFCVLFFASTVSAQSISILNNDTYDNVKAGNRVDLEVQLSGDFEGTPYVWFVVTAPDGRQFTTGTEDDGTVDRRYIISTWYGDEDEGEWRYRPVAGTWNKGTIYAEATEEIVINVAGSAITTVRNPTMENVKVGHNIRLEARMEAPLPTDTPHVWFLIEDESGRVTPTGTDDASTIDGFYYQDIWFDEPGTYTIRAAFGNWNRSPTYATSDNAVEVVVSGQAIGLLSSPRIDAVEGEVYTLEAIASETDMERYPGSTPYVWFVVTAPDGRQSLTSTEDNRTIDNRWTIEWTAPATGRYHFQAAIGNWNRSPTYAVSNRQFRLALNPRPFVSGWYFDPKVSAWLYTSPGYYPLFYRLDDQAILWFDESAEDLRFWNFDTEAFENY